MNSMTRRTILKNVAGVPAAITILGAQDKAGSKRR